MITVTLPAYGGSFQDLVHSMADSQMFGANDAKWTSCDPKLVEAGAEEDSILY